MVMEMFLIPRRFPGVLQGTIGFYACLATWEHENGDFRSQVERG